MERQVENYLYKNIPLTQAMGIHVEQASLQHVILSAPFANNINHKKTVFGGSLHSVATLSCWCLLFLNLKEVHDGHVQIVITKSDADFLAPVDDNFKAECRMPEKSVWQRFFKTLHQKGKARIILTAQIHHNKRLCVDYKGTFAAFKV